MKRILISSKVLPYLMESTTTLQFATDNNNAVNTLSNGDTQTKIKSAQATFGGNVTAQFTPSDGPGESTITVPNAKGGTNGASEALQDNSAEVQKALSNGMNVGVDVSEGYKVFSKKSIEEAIFQNKKKDAVKFTKKELSESFFKEDEQSPNYENNVDNGGNSQDFIRKIGNAPILKVVDAYQYLGDLSDLGGDGDIIEIIAAKYNSAPPETKEKFMQAINA